MPKKFHACLSINKSTQQHSRESYYSPPLFPTIANHFSLHYNPSLQLGLLGMHTKLSNMLFHYEPLISFVSSLFQFYIKNMNMVSFVVPEKKTYLPKKRFRKFPGGEGSQEPKCEPKLEFSEGGGSSNPKISVRVVWSIIVSSSSNLVIHNPWSNNEILFSEPLEITTLY